MSNMHIRVPVPSERALLVGKIIVGIVTLVVFVYFWVLVWQLKGDRDDAKQVNTDQTAAISAAETKLTGLDTALDKANERLEANDLPPVPVPSVAPTGGATAPPGAPSRGERGLRGERGPGPTKAQVAAAVATECADGCASIRLLNAAVERYCAANVCGTPGEPGTQGEQGPVGPGASDEQVQAQVDLYCAVNVCGTPGPRGDPGTALPGTYGCPEGEAMRGFTVAEGGAVTLDCARVVFLP